MTGLTTVSRVLATLPALADPAAGASPAPVIVPGTPGDSGAPVESQQPLGSAPATGGRQPGAFDLTFPLLIIGMFVLIIATQVMGARKERRRRADLMASLKKHDRVQTTAGIVGTVQEIIGDEVILKVDETSNTRIRFVKSAIAHVLREAKGAAPSDPPAEVEAKPAGSAAPSGRRA